MTELQSTNLLMQSLAKVIDKTVNGDGPKEIGFVLLIMPVGGPDGARTNYVSNGRREDILVMLKEVVARFEGQAEVKGRA